MCRLSNDDMHLLEPFIQSQDDIIDAIARVTHENTATILLKILHTYSMPIYTLRKLLIHLDTERYTISAMGTNTIIVNVQSRIGIPTDVHDTVHSIYPDANIIIGNDRINIIIPTTRPNDLIKGIRDVYPTHSDIPDIDL